MAKRSEDCRVTKDCRVTNEWYCIHERALSNIVVLDVEPFDRSATATIEAAVRAAKAIDFCKDFLFFRVSKLRSTVRHECFKLIGQPTQGCL